MEFSTNALFIVAFSVAIIVTISIFIYSIHYNAKKANTFLDMVEAYKKKCVSGRQDSYMINQLIEGEIKFHKLPNSADKYKVEKWVNSMFSFMEQDAFKNLMEVEGKEDDRA